MGECERKTVRVKLCSRVFDIIHGIDEAIQILADKKADAIAQGYTDITLTFGYDHKRDETISWVHGGKEETDTEYIKRLIYLEQKLLLQASTSVEGKLRLDAVQKAIAEFSSRDRNEVKFYNSGLGKAMRLVENTILDLFGTEWEYYSPVESEEKPSVILMTERSGLERRIPKRSE